MGWGLQIGAELTEVLLILSSDSAVDAFKSRAQVMNRRTKEEHTCLFQENTYMENEHVARRIGGKCVCVCVCGVVNQTSFSRIANISHEIQFEFGSQG